MKDQLSKLLKYLGLTATRFADEIGVQRSGISHILSGRNQPSYEFIIKIIKRYPEIDLDWLMMGKGTMLRSDSKTEVKAGPDLFTSSDTKAVLKERIRQNESNAEENLNAMSIVTNVTIMDQIVIFYSDGSCKAYFPASKG